MSEDVIALKNALERVRGERNELREKVKFLETRVREFEIAHPAFEPKELTPRDKYFLDNQNRLNGLTGDERQGMINTIVEEAWQKFAEAEVDATKASNEERLTSLRTSLKKITLEQTARKLLTKIAKPGSDSLLLPHIMQRLTATEANNEISISVLDSDGKPTGRSIDSLIDEFRNTPTFKPVVIGATVDDQLAHQRRVALAIGAPLPTTSNP